MGQHPVRVSRGMASGFPAIGGSPTGFPALISRGLPVFASTGTSANATSSVYSSNLVTTALPSTVAIDVSTVPAAQRASVALYWYNEVPPMPNQRYFNAVQGNAISPTGVDEGRPTAYTIEGNTAAGGGSAPTSGWSTLVTVSANNYCARKHLLNLTGFNWVRMNISTSTNTGVTIKLDLFDIHLATRDIWFVGDSRTWYMLNHGFPTDAGVSVDSIGNLMQPSIGFFPPQIDMGMTGETASEIASQIGQWITDFGAPKAWVLNIGVNDAIVAGAWASSWNTSYQSILNQMVAAGGTVYAESIGIANQSPTDGFIPTYNTNIASMVAGTPGCHAGLDQFTLWSANVSWFGGGTIHLSDSGSALYRPFVASFYGPLL
jgi:hypothetical protein